MKRRGFLVALASLPFIGRWLNAAPAMEMPAITVDVGGSNEACSYAKGMVLDPWGRWYLGDGRPAFIVTAVDYERGTVTMRSCRGSK